MPIEEIELEKRLYDVLGYDIVGSIYCGELPISTMSEEEEKQLLSLRNEKRRESWLRGRHVLKNVMAKMGRPDDTAALGFPNSNFSLSHSRNCAVAVGLDRETVKGIGVDLEFMRATKDGMTRFFLAAEESAWLDKLSDSEKNKQIIRLWTVKEALFKADPENALCTMINYKLAAPAALKGIASHYERDSLIFKYASFYSGDAWISVALSLAPEVRDV